MTSATKLAGSVLAALCFGLFATASLASGPACDAANRDMAAAQAQLSKATRDADTRADAYAQCMSKGGNCGSQKSAYDTALAAKNKAIAALKAATDRSKLACH